MSRSFTVTLTLWLVLTFAAWNALKAYTALAWQTTLQEFFSSTPPILIAGLSTGWSILGLALAYGLAQKKTWSIKILPFVGISYTIGYWAQRWALQNQRANGTFVVIINLILLIVIYLAWRNLSREAYERNTENPKTE